MSRTSRMLNGQYSFDYVTLALEKDKEISPKFTKKIHGSGTSQTQDNSKNAWQKEFTKKLEISVLNKHVHERLKATERAQLDWLTPCFRTPNGEGNSAVRRRCFCESIGPKFCEVCRRKISRELSNRVPRIIYDLRISENELSLLERAEYFVTPEPRFSKHLKQASNFYKFEGYQSSQGDQTTSNTDEDQCLSIENPKNHAISRASSFSSLTSSKDHEFLNDAIVPSSPQNTPNTSPVVPKLPSITSSPDIPNDQPVLTSVPQLPAITNNDPDVFCDAQNSPVIPSDQHILADIYEPQPITIPSDLHNLPDTPSYHHIPVDIPQTAGIMNGPDIPNDSQMFHITHQLRCIDELKADASSLNNPSNQHIPPIIPQQPSSNFSNSQSEMISALNNESDLSCNSDVRRGPSDSNHILPKLSHPVEPVLLELKYINFSIYDYDCNMGK